MKVCVIIPTKNRPDDLEVAVTSLFAQVTSAWHTLLIVDQSPDQESERRVKAALSAAAQDGARWKLRYVRDPEISGGAMARNRAMRLADGEVWLFLDDDVRLEPDFLEQLLAVYRRFPAGGVSGVITNYVRPPFWSRLWRTAFVRGPFRDERQPIYWNAGRLRHSPPIKVRRMGGGLMSFRADLVKSMLFDETLRGVSDGEDVDFCMRLQPGVLLLIAPGARLEHRSSPVGRLSDHWLRRDVRANLFLYEKNWKTGWVNRLSYGWLWTGYCLIALVGSLRRFSLDPWRALQSGARDARPSAAWEPSHMETAAVQQGRNH